MDTAPISIQKIADSFPERPAKRTWLRTWLRKNGSPVREGEYALCWTHHALRVDENPPLDVARLMAESSALPLLVYQSFSEKNRFASERHQTFFLESAQPILGCELPRYSGYVLTSKTKHDLGGFDIVMWNYLPEQVQNLMPPRCHWRSDLTNVYMVLCWSVMLAMEDRWRVPFDGDFINGGSLRWIARDASKPACCPILHTWVLPSTVACA